MMRSPNGFGTPSAPSALLIRPEFYGDPTAHARDLVEPSGTEFAIAQNLGERMMDLGLDAPGLGGPSIPVVPAQVGVDRPVLLGMAPVVGAVEGEPAEGLELALDEVEPARIGGQVPGFDVMAHGPLAQLRLVVRAEVVEDNHEALGEAGRSARSSSRTSRQVLVARMWP